MSMIDPSQSITVAGGSLLWSGLTAVGAVAAAVVAIVQARIFISANRTQATFAHLRAITAALSSVRPYDPAICRSQILGFYAGSNVAMTEEANLYLNFLAELDLLGLAYKNKSVDRRIVDAYVKSLLADTHAVSISFINDLRSRLKDLTVYEDLHYLVFKVPGKKS